AHLVMDYNGTLAVDGEIEPGVTQALATLSPQMSIHVVTADTFGLAADRLAGCPVQLSVLSPGDQDVAKRNYVDALGAENTVAIGNGRNDRLMLQHAGLGVAVILDEGAAFETLAAADVVCRGILPALDLLTRPLRLKATLRS
ncbi:MAG: HAD hydrolase family protein, partial [Desulfobacterales bacterium]|nr:HAD hydrolase family protein [Desulfobacterales bacterium]